MRNNEEAFIQDYTIRILKQIIFTLKEYEQVVNFAQEILCATVFEGKEQNAKTLGIIIKKEFGLRALNNRSHAAPSTKFCIPRYAYVRF